MMPDFKDFHHFCLDHPDFSQLCPDDLDSISIIFVYICISFYDVWMYHSQRIHGTGIFTYIYHKNQPHVGKYTIHGWYGIVFCFMSSSNQILFRRRNSG